MIDPWNEQLFPLSRAKDRIPGRPSLATLHRWAFKGIRGAQLETALLGGRRFTSNEAVTRFIARLSEPRGASTPSPSRLRAEQIALAAKKAAATF